MSTTSKAPLRTLLAAFLGWMFDGMEMGIFPLVARPALQSMAGGLPAETFVQHWMGIITAFFLLGAAAGGLVFGWLGDRIGRVKAMTWSILVYSLCTGLCFFATQPWHLAALRSVAALGMGGEWALGVALVMETWPEKKRPLMAAFIGAAANIGYMVVAVIGLSFPKLDWRWIMVVGAAPAVLTFFIRLFVPESEKWAAQKPRRDMSPLREIFSPPLLRHTLLAIAFSSVPLIVTWGIVQWIPLWAGQLGGGQSGKWAQLFTAGGATLGSLLAPLVGGLIGRRPTYAGLCVLSIGACAGLFLGVHEFGNLFLLAAGVVGLFTAAFYGWLPLYLPELFPTRVRATGQGLAFNSGRLLAALGAWQSGQLMGFFHNSYARAGMTIALVYLVGLTVIWFGPETKNKPLPE